jgi:excisionase family DNA binding protein
MRKNELSSVFFKKSYEFCAFFVKFTESGKLSQNWLKKIRHNAENFGMRLSTALLTPTEMAYTLEISEDTLHALVHSGRIPHTYVAGQSTEEKMLRFNPFIVREWLQTRPDIDDLGQESYIDALRGQFKSLFPDTLSKLKSVDTRFAPRRRRKGYSLSKVPNKQYDFLYYVRYIENGKLIPSRWNTHTKDIKAAESFAQDNRDRIIAAYKNRKEAKDKLYAILGDYYGLNSPYLERDKQRGRHIVEENRQKYFNPFGV